MTLAQEIVDGKRLTREDDLSFFLTCDLDDLCKGAVSDVHHHPVHSS